MRLLLILVMLVHLSGCSLFWETSAGTLVGNLGSELIKQGLDKDKEADAQHPEK